MTYDSTRILDVRNPVTVVELYLDTCAEVWSVSPCTASGSAGDECYNTFKTCQDTANYNKTSKTYRFYQNVNDWPIGVEGYLCIMGQPKFTACKIDPKGSLGRRGTVQIVLNDFADDDIYTDDYANNRTYTPELVGSFFGKLKARTPGYYKGRLMKVRQGYINDTFSFNDFEDRLYVIESIDIDKRGRVTIEGKDLLKLADNKKAVMPLPNTGTLSVAYTASDTTLVLQTGEGADYTNDPYTGSTITGGIPGFVRIGDNVLTYTGVSTDTLTGVVGGQQGSTDDDAAVDDLVQQCLNYTGVNVVDIINHALKTYADVGESYIPYDQGLTTPTGTDDEWDDEKNFWLSGNDLTHMLTAPVGVNKTLERICRQNLIYMWAHERDQEIKLKAIAPPLNNAVPPTLSDTVNILADSMSSKDNDKSRISQVWVYYNFKDITEDLEKPENYNKLKIVVDTNSEGVNAFDESSILVIYAEWLSGISAGLILTLAGRLLSRYSQSPKIAHFELDASDAGIWAGDRAIIDSHEFQDFDGSNQLQNMQILKVEDNHDKQIIAIEAEVWEYGLVRHGFIGHNSLGNYTAETAANQHAYGYICQNDGLYSNGDNGHLIA